MFPTLAEIGPAAAQLTDNNVTVGVFIVLGVVNVLGTIVAIYVALRRNPPIEVDMQKLKEEVRDEVARDLLELRGELNGRLSGLSEKIENKVREMKSDFGGWIRESVAAGEARVRRVEDRLQAVAESAQSDTKEILQAIGSLNAGKVDKK